jgi:hypothetical protein
MVLHSRPEEWLLANGSTPGPQEDCILDRSRAIAVHSHVLWPLQCTSDIWENNGDSLKNPHLPLMSRVHGQHDSDWQHVESVPAVPRGLPKAQFGEVPALRRKYGTSGILSPEGLSLTLRSWKLYGNGWPQRIAPNWKPSGSMHVLQMVYLWFHQHCETTDWTHGGEAGLSVDSRSGGHLPNTKGGRLRCPYSCLPVAKREVHRWHRRK